MLCVWPTTVSIAEIDSAKCSLGTLLSRKYQFHKLRMTKSSLKVSRTAKFSFSKDPSHWPCRFTVSSCGSYLLNVPQRHWTPLIIDMPLIGVCGTDGHIHDGEFISSFPVRERSASFSRLPSIVHSRGLPPWSIAYTWA